VLALVNNWKTRARHLKNEVCAVNIACRDSRTPWYAKALAVCVVGYALSPIDLIPDPVPVLGYLDDLLIVPAGILIVLKLIPADVMNDCRAKAEEEMKNGKPKNWFFAGVIIAAWIAAAALAVWLVMRRLRN
jgi:uncharacterized membrane protein YkvA (DUF1232 family)